MAAFLSPNAFKLSPAAINPLAIFANRQDKKPDCPALAYLHCLLCAACPSTD
ncbi:MAG: hypothetical protein MUO76_18550 [Anaerolineaceae bacterium]|nr:hypothetical protein [Anaerolineaceae bacterium]